MNPPRQQRPSLICLLFSPAGRLGRAEFAHALLLVGSLFYLMTVTMDRSLGKDALWMLSPWLLWSSFAISTQRLHDLGRSGWWLWWAAVPVIGPLYLTWVLLLKRGQPAPNTHGSRRNQPLDYFKNDQGTPAGNGKGWLIDDVSQLNPVNVLQVARPQTVQELQELLRATTGPVSVGGGRFSMGGQTASPDSLHIDLRSLNRITAFSPSEKWIRVESGTRWCDIQQHIDSHDLSVKIMQSYANFTVGGTLSVNAHGRYMGLGPVVLSVRWIELVLADGSLVRASATEYARLFYAAIGGYSAIGVIVAAELDLAGNVPVERTHQKLSRQDYPSWFSSYVRDDKAAVFHNGDLYPPDLRRIRAVTWRQTGRKPSSRHRLMPLRETCHVNRYLIWAFSETPFGHWRRERIIEPLLYLFRRVHWRNYEAGYDVMAIEPKSRKTNTFVLQEYFVPVARFKAFAAQLAEIVIRHRAKVINVSIRHSIADPGTLLAWAPEEVFAFVIYHKQRTDPASCSAVAVWTRELIEAALAQGGSYYLPYQTHATPDQFRRAYPRAFQLFDLKQQLDPGGRFRNVLWDKYSNDIPPAVPTMNTSSSEFHAVFDNTGLRDAFYRFLQIVFHLYPEDRFHHLIHEVCAKSDQDDGIYNEVQGRLKEIKPFLSELTYALPALRKQKGEMTRQTLELLGNERAIDGYVEIGSTGRYISDLRKHLKLSGGIYLINDVSPSHTPGDIFERGQIAKLGIFLPLDSYAPIESGQIPDSSIDLVTIYIGFHHCPTEQLDAFIRSIHRVLRPGGSLILRDHDVKTPAMATFVSLVHTVFNLGLGVPFQTNENEFKRFRSMDEWIALISSHGFSATSKRLLQFLDPSDNTLVRLIKR